MIVGEGTNEVLRNVIVKQAISRQRPAPTIRVK